MNGVCADRWGWVGRWGVGIALWTICWQVPRDYRSLPDFPALPLFVPSSLSLLVLTWKYQLWRIKRICVFEHSVKTNFNCTCPAIQRGQGSGFLPEGSSWLMLVWASSRGSGETARMRRLIWTFAARIGDKYQIRLTWPNWYNMSHAMRFWLFLSSINSFFNRAYSAIQWS